MIHAFVRARGRGLNERRRDKPEPISLRQRVRARALDVRRVSTVAVVIPCFNYAQYLPDAVASVLSQDGVAVEVIIVNDASTDDSGDVAQRLARDNSRIRVIEHEVNRGPVQTFNDGLEERLASSSSASTQTTCDTRLATSFPGRAPVLPERWPRLWPPRPFPWRPTVELPGEGYNVDAVARPRMGGQYLPLGLQCRDLSRGRDALERD